MWKQLLQFLLESAILKRILGCKNSIYTCANKGQWFGSWPEPCNLTARDDKLEVGWCFCPFVCKTISCSYCIIIYTILCICIYIYTYVYSFHQGHCNVELAFLINFCDNLIGCGKYTYFKAPKIVSRHMKHMKSMPSSNPHLGIVNFFCMFWFWGILGLVMFVRFTTSEQQYQVILV